MNNLKLFLFRPDTKYNTNSVFMHAIYQGDVDMIKLLCTYAEPEDFLYRNADGDSVLDIACESSNNNKNSATIIRTLALIFKQLDINEANTALIKAISVGNIPAMAILLSAGVDVNIPTEDGQTPLMLFIKLLKNSTNNKGFSEKQEKAITNIFNILVEKSTIDAVDKEGNTALHHAICSNNSSVIGVLRRNGYDVNVQNNDKLTPVQFIKDLESLKELNEIKTGNSETSKKDSGMVVGYATTSSHETRQKIISND